MMAVEMVVFISWMRPAPNSWDTTTVQPMDSPEATATDKNTMGKGGAHGRHCVFCKQTR